MNLTLRRRHWHRLRTHTRLSFWLYRYRYLTTFAVIGFCSVVLEILLISAMPSAWPIALRTLLGFSAGLAFSFVANATVNFEVPKDRLLSTFVRFAIVSGLSFALNLAVVFGLSNMIGNYGPTRLVTAGTLFLIAYTLHRRFTFDLSRNFGVAVYASTSERVSRIFYKLGRNCDHVHIDLVDETMNPTASNVDVSKIADAKKYWPDLPFCLHIMSLYPAAWVQRVGNDIDWFLFHINSHDDLYELIANCRLRGKKVGVVWHISSRVGDVLPYLPHVDFVMVLGIAAPGKSGQKLLDEAVEVAVMLDALRPKYGFEVMFDGGVKTETLGRIPAKYIVAASAVLQAENPIHASHTLRTGAQYVRRAA